MKENNETSTKKTIANVYDEIAQSFDTKRRRPWDDVVDFINNLQHQNLALDLGCGNGRHTKLLLEKGCSVIGLDVSFKILEVALKKELLTEKSNLVGMINGDGTDLPFMEKTFDTIISIAVIHHFKSEKQRIRILSEIYRILQDDGLAFISCWLKTHPRFQKDDLRGFIEDGIQDVNVPWNLDSGEKIMRYYYLFEPSELIEIVENIGFKIIQQNISRHNLYRMLKRK